MTLRRHLAAAALALALATPALAQDFVFGFSPRTGDAFVDAQLGDINVYARGDTSGFIDDVVVSLGAPRVLVRELYLERRWAPGDIYYACALAQAVGRPCRHVLDLWRGAHGSGWEAAATGLGVPVGSPDFARIAEGIVASYLRWGRPLPAPVTPAAVDPAEPAR